MDEVKLEHATVVSLQPDDVVVLRAPVLLHMEQREKLAGLLRNRFPKNRVLVLDAAVDLCIVRPEK